MPAAKLVVIYPRPTDEAAFEKTYVDDHIPMVEDKLKGMSRLVLTKVIGSPTGKVNSYRIAELHFPSLELLQQVLGSEPGQEVARHAAQISTGGAPILLICEEETRMYW